MKICIVTVYNSENCGSYLQAHALQTYLKQQGHEVVFLKREEAGSSRSISYRIREIGKSLLKRNIKQVKLIVDRHKGFNRVLENFRVIELHNTKDIDLFIIGSDTVWDFQDSYFRKQVDLYTGVNFGKVRFITYAASCANTTVSDVKSYKIDLSNLRNAAGISVRDNATAHLIQQCLSVDTVQVCDPTLLLTPSDYGKFDGSPIQGNYLLLYIFGALERITIEKIVAFAKNRNLKIVSIGSALSWCDQSVPASPQSFIEYYRFADCVITNTFHGTVFSTIFEKSFAVVTSRKNKITEFLTDLGISDRIIYDPGSIAQILEQKIDYETAGKKLKSFKELSILFLNQFI